MLIPFYGKPVSVAENQLQIGFGF